MGDTLSTSDRALQELAPASQTQLTHFLHPSHTQHFTVRALFDSCFYPQGLAQDRHQYKPVKHN